MLLSATFSRSLDLRYLKEGFRIEEHLQALDPVRAVQDRFGEAKHLHLSTEISFNGLQ